jgi:hypothetical protein
MTRPEAYKLLRSLMNSHIRYAHRLQMLETLLVVLSVRRHVPGIGGRFSNQIKEATLDLSPEQKKLFDSYYVRIMKLVFRKVVLGSAFVMLVLPAVIGLLAIRHGIDLLLRGLKNPVDMVNGTAMAEGESDMNGLCAA